MKRVSIPQLGPPATTLKNQAVRAPPCATRCLSLPYAIHLASSGCSKNLSQEAGKWHDENLTTWAGGLFYLEPEVPQGPARPSLAFVRQFLQQALVRRAVARRGVQEVEPAGRIPHTLVELVDRLLK